MDDNSASTVETIDLLIVGAGFSGLGMAIALRKAGRDDFVVIDKGPDVGGTWRVNTYPGCACDVPSHLYSFSFELNPEWPRRYAAQPDILRYLQDCTDRYGVRQHIRFDSALTGARFDAGTGRWRVDVNGEPAFLARHLVLALGPLHRPSTPEFDGLERFEGDAFHSAEWNHDAAIEGRDVVVVGTGASAIQFVPHLARSARRLTLIQRTPPWVMPKADGEVSRFERGLYRTIPGLMRLYRSALYGRQEARGLGFTVDTRVMRLIRKLCLRYLHKEITDPTLRRQLTPDYLPGCKRILLSNDFYPAVRRSNVTVTTETVDRVTADAVLLADGTRVPADTLVFGTGFKVTEPLPTGLVYGRDGQDLARVWATRMQAFKGTVVSGFPNMYVLLGPNTGLGHNSVVFMAEAQIDYIMQIIGRSAAEGDAVFEVKRQVQDAFNRGLRSRLSNTVWASGCRSWYLDADGHNPTIWPGTTMAFWHRLRRLNPLNFTKVGR